MLTDPWPLPEFSLSLSGADVVVTMGDATITGRLSARVLFASDVWGAVARSRGLDVGRVWPYGIERSSPALALPLRDAGLALLERGEATEAEILLGDALEWLPGERDATLTRVPSAMASSLQRRLDIEHAPLSFARAFAHLEGQLASREVPVRAVAGDALEEVTRHFTSTAGVRRTWTRARGALLASAADEHPRVRESALSALAVVAFSAWQSRELAVLDEILPRLRDTDVAAREMAALRFERLLSSHDRVLAEAAWQECERLAFVAGAPQPRHLFEAPTWRDRRAIHLTEAARTLLDDKEPREAVSLLREAVALVLEGSHEGPTRGRGFAWRTFFAQGVALEALGDAGATASYKQAREAHARLDGSNVPHEIDDAIARLTASRVDVRGAVARNLVDALASAGAIELAEDGRLGLEKTLATRMPKSAGALLGVLMRHEGVAEVFCDEESLGELLERFGA